MTEITHTDSPITYRQITRDGHIGFTLDTTDAEIEICEIFPKPNLVAVNEGNARLLTAGWNAFDSAAKRLGLNAVEFAERMQDGGIAELLTVLEDVAEWLADGTVDGVHFEEVAVSEAVRDVIAKARGQI